MNDEDALHALLDANPDDWQTRLILADWLDDYHDPKGWGYRALAYLGKRPAIAFYPKVRYTFDPSVKHWCWLQEGLNYSEIANRAALPEDWLLWKLVDGQSVEDGTYNTRREAEDAAALAFAYLPAGRRAKLLTMPPRVRDRKKVTP